MELRTVRCLRGPNLWSRCLVLEATLTFDSADELTEHQLAAFETRLLDWLPSLQQRSGNERPVEPVLLPRLRLARGLERVALELQRLAGSDVWFGRTQTKSSPTECTVVVEYREEEVGRAALNAAMAICSAALANDSCDIAATVAELRTLNEQIRLGPSTGSIVRAAENRGIPARRLNEGSLVQFGYGVKQRRILAAETDRTSAIAESIAQDKELTKRLLRAAGVPVPCGRPVSDVEDAWAAAEEIGGPVVVKPQYGNQGRGVAVNLTTREQVAAAYEAARQEADTIIVEQFAPGGDYRLLVVGERMVAAARREPPLVVGDGKHTIRELVEIENRDPRRGEDHATVLSKLRLDDIALAVLAEQGLSPEFVPAEGARIIIRRNANLSTGGTAEDVTDLVHPEVAARAVDAARMVGLDIAGVDVVASDISRPLEEQGGVIVEVNAAPGLRMHLHPSAGTPRAVGEAIIEMMFPEGENPRIPVIAVTGTNGKTTVTRCIAHHFRTAGRKVGMTCTEGVYVDDHCLDSGDCSGPRSAKLVLMHPQVEAAVLETARGGILREGLAFDQCDVAVITNIGSGDHLGLGGIETIDQLAQVKSTLVEAVSEKGTAVLNAADPLVVAMAGRCRGRIAYFALEADNPVIVAHRERGGRAAFARDGFVVLAEGEREIRVAALNRVPLTLDGRIGFQIENVLASAAAAWCAGLSIDQIRESLETFTGGIAGTPGRFNMLELNGASIILDYGHNVSSLHALVKAIEAIPHERRLIVYTVAGDRRDEDVIEQARIIGREFDHVVIYEDGCTRGRPDGEIVGLMWKGLAGAPRASHIYETRGEIAAVESALTVLRPGDLLVIQVDRVESTIDWVRQYVETQTAAFTTGEQWIEVRDGRLGKEVIATRRIEAATTILQGWGRRIPQRSRHSFQVDHDTHIVISSPIGLINHSCEPNCGVLVQRGANILEIHALRTIEPGEELTTDYATFEYEIEFMNDQCQCGSPRCRGRITGYKDLPPERRREYQPYIAEYLEELERQPLAGAGSTNGSGAPASEPTVPPSKRHESILVGSVRRS